MGERRKGKGKTTLIYLSQIIKAVLITFYPQVAIIRMDYNSILSLIEVSLQNLKHHPIIICLQLLAN